MRGSLIPPRIEGIRRVGMFGGAFDPPHHAHLALAQAAMAQLHLDELHVIPTGHAWHKSRTLSPVSHRLAMTHLAFDNLPGVVVDDREVHRAGPSFTVDTLSALATEQPGAQLFLVMGADQFAAFKQWHRWPDILALAIICIATRAYTAPVSATFNDFFDAGGRVLMLNTPLMGTSATQIRQMASSHVTSAGVDSLVPAAVASYIAAHGLYLSL